MAVAAMRVDTVTNTARGWAGDFIGRFIDDFIGCSVGNRLHGKYKQTIILQSLMRSTKHLFQRAKINKGIGRDDELKASGWVRR